jgi:hypothetical protein
MAAPSRWTCPSEDTLFHFSTGDASRWQRARLQRHLDRCAACAARLDGWEAATAAYREFVNGPPSAVGADAVAARIAGLGNGGPSGGARAIRSARNAGGSGSSRDDDGIERARLARFEARLRREPLEPPRTVALAWSRQVLSLRRPPIGWRSIAAAVVLVAGGLFGFLPLLGLAATGPHCSRTRR